ncbi:alkaline phosphatase D family protein [Lignipirellula cremea]|uniref:Alkaline phosphatase D n=1 Tax=Lignipirellula cremea TaxID=2528010 RepID=A0A518DNN3_9BACT|nr:alkaline phosphatase D family protein [Lignipirellula cremea]QDU93447.1 Alkaline phosphatase D precursor [Lignipirellula cremea]
MKRTNLRAAIVALALAAAAWSPATAKEIIPTPADTPVLGELEPVLIKAILGDDPEASLAAVAQQPELAALLKKHHLELFSGPMLGCVTDTSARFWVRTIRPAKIQIELQSTQDDKQPVLQSSLATTQADKDFTAVVEAVGLAPRTEYAYQVLLDGKPMLPERAVFRTAPAKGQPAQVQVAFGGGSRLVPEHEHIWDTIAKRRPDAFLFLGDNVYIDDPTHRSRQRLYYYRRQLRPEFRRMSAGCGVYAIWDDHDFGANDTQGGPDPFKPDWKLPVWKVFRENWNNAYYGGGPEQPGCWFDFSIGDIDFFMTDGRYYREFKPQNGEPRTMLGPVQKKWLLEKLKKSTATFKVIVSGTLWTETADKGGRDSWWGAREEREELFTLIDEQPIPGVILLSADRHRTDVYRIARPKGYDLFEFETSKLTNHHTHPTRPAAIFSYNEGNFYGLLTFNTELADPEVTFRCITIDDEEVYKLTLKRSQLERAQ